MPTTSQPDPLDPTNFDIDAFIKLMNSGPDDFIRQAEETKVPGLANRVRELYAEGGGGIEGVGAPFFIRASEEINKAKSDPAGYASERLNMLARDYTLGTAKGYDAQFAKNYGEQAPARLDEIKALQSYLTSNNYATNDQISAALSAGEQAATSQLITDKRAGESGSFKEAVRFVAPIVLGAVVPGLGSSIGSALGLGTGTAATVVGQSIVNTVLNGGDLKSGIVAAAIPVVGKEVAGSVAKTFIESGMDKAVANTVGKVVANTGVALIQGKDPVEALLSSGINAGASAAVNEIAGLSDAPAIVKNTIINGVTAELVNGNGIQSAVNSLINTGISQANTQASKLAPLSDEELSDLTPAQRAVYDKSGTAGLIEHNRAQKAGTASDADINALTKSGLTTTDPANLVVTGDKGYDDFMSQIYPKETTPAKDSGLSNDDIAKMIGLPVEEKVTVTGKGDAEAPATQLPYLPTDDDFVPTIRTPELVVADKSTAPTDDILPIFQTPVSPKAPDLGNVGNITVVGDRPAPTPPLDLSTDPVKLITDPLQPPTLPPAAQPPAAKPPASSAPAINIDPVQALDTLYNPFAPSPASRSTPSQTDTGPIQLMTDVFGTNIASAQKTGARGYGFSAGGDIDELLRLLRS